MRSELHKTLEEFYRNHSKAVEKIRAAFELVANGFDPRDVADECTKLGDVFHWRWGPFRVAWFWDDTGRVIVLEAWRKKSMKEQRDRVQRLNDLHKRYESETNEFDD